MSKKTDDILVKTYRRVEGVELNEIEEVDEKEVNRVLQTKHIDMLTLDNRISNLMGQLLTLMEASISDPVQRKAMKDVIRDYISEWHDDLYALSDLN
jgi:uncharacterized protein YjcR